MKFAYHDINLFFVFQFQPFLRHEDPQETESNTFWCKNMSKFNLRPKKAFGFDSSNDLTPMDTEKIVFDTLEILRNGIAEGASANTADSNVTRKFNADSYDECSMRSMNVKRNIKEDNDEHEFAPPKKICKCSSFNTEDQASGNEERKCTCESDKNNRNRFPFVVFLGTGSSIPSKYRNVTSILLHSR